MMKEILIYDHRTDPSIRFLAGLFPDFDAVAASGDLYDRFRSASDIRRAIREADRVWMLGHGTEAGLGSRTREMCESDRYVFDRNLVDSDTVQFLRDKECIGIWCNADRFAYEYCLRGLFSGMIISDPDEAAMVAGTESGVMAVNRDTVDECNAAFARDLRFCLENYPLREVPERMADMCPFDAHPVMLYNYNNLFYFD